MNPTPLAIEIALHYYRSPLGAEFKRVMTRTVQEWHVRFQEAGMLMQLPAYGYVGTPLLTQYVRRLGAVPLTAAPPDDVTTFGRLLVRYRTCRDYAQKITEKCEAHNNMILALEQQVTCLVDHVRSVEDARQKAAERPPKMQYHAAYQTAYQAAYHAELNTASRTGVPWTRGEEEELIHGYRVGRSLPIIAKGLKREWQAIVIRLRRLSGMTGELSEEGIREWRECFFGELRSRWRVGRLSVPFTDLCYAGKQ